MPLTQISNCPYCGSTDQSVSKDMSETSVDYFVECKNCKAQGPHREMPEKAVCTWNAVAGG